MSEKNQFEEFEEVFAGAFPGAKCFKFVVHFETADGDLVSVGLVREGCEKLDEAEQALDEVVYRE